MTTVYFVRHAQPDHTWQDDRTRPLTNEGREDAKAVLEALKAKHVDICYCSPYLRCMDTIAETAAHFGLTIRTDERLRERESGPMGNQQGMFQKRWADFDFHEPGGESLRMVQERNMAAFQEILTSNPNQNILIGTHGTALSCILHHYDPSFDCNDFLRIIDWMPYILVLRFEGTNLIGKEELLHIYKEFRKTAPADAK